MQMQWTLTGYLLLLCLPALSAFAFGAGGLGLRAPVGARVVSRMGVVMQTKSPGDDEREYPKFEPDMAALNERISKLKAREANPIYKLQDTVSDTVKDTVDPIKLETRKVLAKVPDPRNMMPVTGMPPWALPLGIIIGLSLLTSILQNQATYNPAGLASGSL